MLIRTVLLITLAALALPASAMARPADGAGAASARTSGDGTTGTGAGAVAAKRGVTITTRRISGFGEVLVDGRGLPLYAFGADRGKRSNCYGACTRAWPVTYAKGTPVAGRGAKAALLGTTRRRDGGLQVTYRGRPLYFYVSDRPGVALCHGVREFGGVWVLVRGSGKLVA